MDHHTEYSMLEDEYCISLVCVYIYIFFFLRTYHLVSFTKEFYALQSVIIMVLHRERTVVGTCCYY